jgi:type III secretory pathway component EscV
MQDETARDAIERLEEEIERLTLKRERCRKLSLAAKRAIAAGALWLVLTLLGLAPFLPSLFFAALAALIGGIVLLGSNATTWDQTDAAIEKADAARARLIEGIALRVVDGAARVH